MTAINQILLECTVSYGKEHSKLSIIAEHIDFKKTEKEIEA